MTHNGSFKTVGDLLIIDDTIDNLDMLTEIMGKRGFRVRACLSPELGRREAHDNPPDLILLDVGLPGIDGYTLCREFKSDPILADVPIIFISAFSHVDHKIKGFEAGGVDYIGKPFHAQEVIARVESHLALKRIRQQESELAVLRERNRIARDLHDAVSQTLFSVGLMIENLITHSDHNESTRQTLHRLSQLAGSANAEMRTILYELRPDALTGADLADLLTNLADAVAGRTGAAITTHLESLTLPPDIQIAFYRIAQEATNNIIKHARPNAVLMELAGDGMGGALMLIADDGRGFDPERVRAGRFGLESIAERAARVGANIQIESAPDHGTTLRLAWQMVEVYA
jgi:signal transduction histidine kinase